MRIGESSREKGGRKLQLRKGTVERKEGRKEGRENTVSERQ